MVSKLTRNDRTKMQHLFWCPNDKKETIKQDKLDYEIYSTSQNTFDSMEEDSIISKVSQTQKTENKTEDKKTNLFPYKFEWKGPGNNVVLAGSFLENWKKYEPLKKNISTGSFERIEYLSKTRHYFKFIVDNKWMCSNLYYTIKDKSNNINNFIDLTNYIPSEELFQEDIYHKNDKKEEKISNSNLHKKTIIFGKKNEYNFNSKYKYSRLLKDLNSIPPSIISSFKPSFKIDYISNQNKIKKVTKKNWLKYKIKNGLTDNKTYKKIFPCPYDKLMHFCLNINNIKSDYKTYIKTCATVRNKHKNLTVVYYKPKPNEETDYY